MDEQAKKAWEAAKQDSRDMGQALRDGDDVGYAIAQANYAFNLCDAIMGANRDEEEHDDTATG